ncbi:SURF1 family protein [Iodobacter arcticus]|uniref:SURF1-like protein n=1 Tax=Iodobacter arcticus TaxID=590593 RepID=A0ABW2QTN9_9NEIS
MENPPLNPILAQRRLSALICLAILILITFCMGLWQLSRAHDKQILIKQLAEQEALPPLPWATGTPPLFRPIKLIGQWLPQAEILLDHRIEAGQIGYHVITPFQLSDQSIVLVNRGWWPDTQPPKPSENSVVSTQPWPRYVELAHTQPTEHVFQNINPERFAAWSKLPLPIAYALIQTSEKGLKVQHSQPAIPPERHLGYTATWWGMSIVGIFLWIRFKRETRL